MLIRVLGSAAGGGVPQWNCGCANCEGVRNGTALIEARTQECVAISADGATWFLLNASPEVRAQIESFPPLWPRAARHSPIGGILLTNGDLDHCLGLFSLRESQPLAVYATAPVRTGLEERNVIFRTLKRFPDQVRWPELPLDQEVPLCDAEGKKSGLFVRATAVPGKQPLHLEGMSPAMAEDNVGFQIREGATGKRLAYFPGVGAGSERLAAALDRMNCVFFDGTFWRGDELVAAGLGTRTAQEMAHWPIDGAAGSLPFLTRLRAARRILIHINNTNPILREDAPERARLTAAGIEVAYDGLELSL